MVERYDGWGKLVPAYLREVFRGRKELLDWVRRMEAFRTEIAQHGQQAHASRIDVKRVVRHLEAARALVIRGAPFTACDCGVPACEKCRGERWLTIDQLNPPTMKGPL